MNALKETPYECTYASTEETRTASYMAWDPREAVELFAHELHAEGVAEHGIIQVRAHGDRTVRSAAYPLT